jgi:histidinol-phosphatase
VFTFDQDLALALELADEADRISLPRFRALDLSIETKPDLSPVTDADKSVEKSLIAMLAQKRPADAIIGEEFGSSGQGSRKWIIDPIDGTANFVRGVPVWASLIALSIDGKPTVSVVSAPAMGARWWAAPGIGAHTKTISGSERKLSVSKVSKLEDCSLSYNNLQLWQRSSFFPELLKLSETVWRTRAYGDFWSYMLLAEGSVDMVAEHDLQIYDIAALVPIIEQAGGTISDLQGQLSEHSSSVLATNSLLHQKAQKFFERIAK